MQYIGKIINNKKILDEFWSSNTPNQYNAIKNHQILLTGSKITSGILIVEDIFSKEIQVYYGLTEIINGVEDRKMLLEIGNKLPVKYFKNFIKQKGNQDAK